VSKAFLISNKAAERHAIIDMWGYMVRKSHTQSVMHECQTDLHVASSVLQLMAVQYNGSCFWVMAPCRYWLLDDWALILSRGRDFSLSHHAHTGSGVHTASYPMDAVGLFTRDKVARA